MNIKFLTTILIALLAISGCEDKGIDESAIAKNRSSTALSTLDTKIITIDKVGDLVTSKEYTGKAILLDFFATWCPPCKATIPHLVHLQNKYKDKFVVIGVLLEEGKSNAEIKDFATGFNINYEIVNSPNNYILAQEFGGIRSIPTMFLYSPNGQLINMYQGAVPEEMIESDLKRALGK